MALEARQGGMARSRTSRDTAARLIAHGLGSDQRAARVIPGSLFSLVCCAGGAYCSTTSAKGSNPVLGASSRHVRLACRKLTTDRLPVFSPLQLCSTNHDRDLSALFRMTVQASKDKFRPLSYFVPLFRNAVLLLSFL